MNNDRRLKLLPLSSQKNGRYKINCCYHSGLLPFRSLKIPITKLKGVGKKRAELLEKLGVVSVYDFLHTFPKSYIDFTSPVPIIRTIPGESYVISVKITKKISPYQLRKGLTLYRLYAQDATSPIQITIFNNHFAYDAFEVGKIYDLYGKITGNFKKREIHSPLTAAHHEFSFRPVYALTKNLTSKMMITNMKETLRLLDKEVCEPLPFSMVNHYQLMDFKNARRQIHFPENYLKLQIAKKRLVFEELLCWQLGLLLIRNQKKSKTKVKLSQYDLKPFFAQLPFTPTKGQKQAIQDCVDDLQQESPMNRLLQGDVGCGKTLVAAALCYLMATNHYQTAMMAPTEILARQHYDTLTSLLGPLNIKIALLTGSLKSSEKKDIKKQMADGTAQIIVGTHALFQNSASFLSLGLVITDEQHRFGVEQRQKLAQKGNHPHTLVMSATPIPRTLALIFYGDLDISVIKEIPKGRTKIKTFCIAKANRKKALGFMQHELQKGRQAYLVCPAIEADDRGVANIEQYAKPLKKWFSSFKIGIIHSKLPADIRESTMQAFKNGDIHLLLGTTVIEVGIDVPNATVMMIENAELFGLSQLHQLRGRVGRGKYPSYCLLISNTEEGKNEERLQTLCETGDGFMIAEKDLKLRGPGDFFGYRQHGLPNFKIANMFEDLAQLKKARRIAEKILEEDPKLEMKKNYGLRFLLKELFEDFNITL